MREIKEEGSCYYAFQGEDEGWVEISNFIIKIKYQLIDGDNIKREVIFKSNGVETNTFMLDPSHMVGVSAFKTFCLDKGNYIFEGKGCDLNEIWKQEFEENEDAPEVYLVNEVGFVEEHKIWLFKNRAIKGKRTIRPDDNGVFWINDDKGLKINPLSSGRALPKLKKTPKDFDIGEEVFLVEKMLNENIGGFNGSVILGYIVSTVYSLFLYKKLGFFPILFVYGKYQSGKNIFCELVVKFFRLNMNYATSAQENSQAGISRLLSYYAYIPVWINEYRNIGKIKWMSGYFRNVFNKESPVKALREDFGVRDVPLKGNLILSGEEMPMDAALRSRCFPVYLKTKERKDSTYKTVQEISKDFSKITYFLIKNINRKNGYDLLDIIENLKQEYIKQKISSRQAEVFALIAGGRKFLDKYTPVNEGFDEWLISHTKSEKKRMEEESPVTIFWETIEGLISKGIVARGEHVKRDLNTGKVYIWFAELYRAYEKDIRQRGNDNVRARQAILDQFKEEPYFIEGGHSTRIGKDTRTCIVLNYKKCPESIQRLFKDMN